MCMRGLAEYLTRVAERERLVMLPTATLNEEIDEREAVGAGVWAPR